MDDKRDYDARPNMFYQQNLLEDVETDLQKVHDEFDAFMDKRRDAMPNNVVSECDEVFNKIDEAEEALQAIRESMGGVINLFDDAKYCDICGDMHDIDCVPLSCQTGDGE